MVRVLFVCLGNICRSPLAEGIMRHHVREAGLAAEIAIASAGTGSWHVGEPPHEGSQLVALAHGIDLAAQRARHLRPEDLAAHDYVVAMDQQNLSDIIALDPQGRYHDRVFRLLELVPELGERDVPDPYHAAASGFEHVYRLVEAGTSALLERIAQEHGLRPEVRR